VILAALITVVVGVTSVGAQSQSEIGIDEFMADPTKTTDARGEWIELKNNSTDAMDLTDWDIDGSTIVGLVQIDAGQSAVICKTADQTLNGGVVCDGVSGFSFGNSGDTINLRNQTNQVVDSIEYSQTDVVAGKSNSVRTGGFDLAQNIQYGLGDFGSPANNKYGHILTHAILERNGNRKPDLLGGETFSEGYTYRLYQIAGGSWTLWNTDKTTSSNFPAASWLIVPPASYAVCLETPDAQFATFAMQMSQLFQFQDARAVNLSDNDKFNDVSCARFDVEEGKFDHNYLGVKKMIGNTSSIQVNVLNDTDGNGRQSSGETFQSNWQVRVFTEEAWASNSPHFATITGNQDQKYQKIDTGDVLGDVVVCLVNDQAPEISFAKQITSFASSNDVMIDQTSCALTTLVKGETQTLLFGVDLL
jgi:hypothetical protein